MERNRKMHYKLDGKEKAGASTKGETLDIKSFETK